MNAWKTRLSMRAGTLALCALAGCATPLPATDAAPDTQAALRASFAAHGQAGIERLQQDEAQELCSRYRNQPPAEVAANIQQTQRAAIQYPPRLMGDWRAGDGIARSGVGRQFTDDPANPAGGNCYACHQLAPAEVVFGNIGPGLAGYGKLRGANAEAQRETYARIYNAQAANACSKMPRFGHNGVLTPEQISHLVALLLDPASPVNR
jgi:sulfur-oxidizing protein SoxX